MAKKEINSSGIFLSQKKIWEQLNKITVSNRLGNAYLFSGPPGSGKEYIATKFAQVLNCEEQKGFIRRMFSGDSFDGEFQILIKEIDEKTCRVTIIAEEEEAKAYERELLSEINQSLS